MWGFLEAARVRGPAGNRAAFGRLFAARGIMRDELEKGVFSMRKGGKKPWRKGFTLAECLVVVSIITVLLAVAIPNVIAYYRALKLTELDDSARTIFVAAQNRLSAMLSSGEDLESLSTDKVNLNNPPETAVGEYFYLRKAAGDAKDEKLGSVLPGGSIENQLDKWNYVVEFDPKTGAVYAVWYWEKGSFNYATEAYAGVTPDKDQRLKDHRMVGYYGGTRIKRTEINQLPFPEVTLINAEELRLNITLPDREGLTDANFRVDVKVNGVEILKDANIWAGEDHSYAVVLDTLKGEGTYVGNTSMGSSDWVFGHQFKKWTTLTAALAAAGVKPGDDITVSVTLRYYNDGSGSVTYLPNTQYVKSNSLFAALRDGGSTAEIVYGRHLQNLDSNTSGVTSEITAAKQVREINFALENPTPGNKENDIYYWANTYQETNDPGYRAFVPIKDRVDYDGQSLPIRSLYSESAGGLFGAVNNGTEPVKWNNIVLIDTKINATTNYVGALAGSVESAHITNCQVYLEKNAVPYDPDHPDASIEPQLKTTSFAIGGLVGQVRGDGNSITDSFAATVISGDAGVSGLVASMDGGSTLTIDHSYAACHLTATGGSTVTVSGFVNVGNDYANLTVTNCYAAGVIADGGYVNGLVYRAPLSGRHCKVTINDSYAAVRYGDDLRSNNQVFGTVEQQDTTYVSGDHVYYVAQSGIDYKDSFGTKVTTKELSEMPATGAAGVDPDAKTLGGEWYHLPAEKEGETPPTNPLDAAFPYNQTEETAELLAPYPYPQLAVKDPEDPAKTLPMPHHGDWLESSVDVDDLHIAYFVQYDDPTIGDGGYGFYAAEWDGSGATAADVTCVYDTLYHDAGHPTALSDGYAILSPTRLDTSAVTFTLNGAATPTYHLEALTAPGSETFEVATGKTLYAYRLDTDAWNAAVAAASTPGAPYYQTLTVAGCDQVLLFDPLFAREAFTVTPAAGATVTPPTVPLPKPEGTASTEAYTNTSNRIILETARQLANVFVKTTTNTNATDAAAYQGRVYDQLLDIDYATYSTPNGGNSDPFTTGTPSGTPQTPLTLNNGQYQGHDHSISNLHADVYTSGNYTYGGLVGRASNSTLQDVTLINATVQVTGGTSTNSKVYLGALAGWVSYTEVTNCGAYVQADTSIGLNSADDAYRTCTVLNGTVSNDFVGGLVGFVDDSTVSDSYAAVKVTGCVRVGGFAGSLRDCTVTNCYAGGHTESRLYTNDDPNVRATQMSVEYAYSYAGGFAGLLTDRVTFAADSISYSTASVGGVGSDHVGQFIGNDNNYVQRPANSGQTQALLYATGATFQQATTSDDYTYAAPRNEDYLSAPTMVTQADTFKTHPYDDVLKDMTYPYKTNLPAHHGDWPEPPKGQLVYWEQCGTEYGTGKPAYLFYGGENSEINCLPGADHEVTLDGYGILVPAGKEVPEVFVPDYSSDPLELELLSEASFRGKNYDLYGFKLPMKTFTGSGDYYHRIYVVADELWFNPDFACEVFAEQPADLTKPAAKTLTEYGTAIPLTGGESGYVIRSARQLVNKAKYSGLHDKIYQWMNIDFATYDAGTVRFYATPVDGQSEDSPYSQPMRLLSGGAYTCHGFDTGPGGGSVTNPGERALEIRNLYIGGQAGSYVNAIGLFDHVGDVDPDNPAILKNLHLVNVDVSGDGSQDSSVGGLAGTVSGAAKIENCGIYVSSADDYDNFTIQGGGQSQYVGGLFGYINQSGGAQPVLENCFAAVKVVSGSRMWTSTGGFAGNVYNCTIKNCYSGGHTVNGKYVDTVREDANVVERGSNPSGTGGFLGTSSNVTFEGVCYSTCSVYGKSYDGYTGALIGHAYTDPTLAPGATVYATGKAVTADGGKTLRNESYLSPALTTAPTSGQADATRTKYDTTLTNKYPYQAAEGQTVHHGDWYVPDISAAFYWEKEQVYSWNATQSKWVAEGEPEYHYHLMGVSEMSELENKYHDVNTLCTERHDDGKIHQIDHYGYGVLTTGDGTQTRAWGGESCGMMSPVTSSFTTDEIAVKALIEKELGASTKYFGVYQCDKALSHEYNQYKYVLSIDGAPTRTIFFTIDFADLYLVQKNNGPETFTIRSARQLDNIINNRLDTTYVQDHDVGAVGYNGYTAPDIQSLTYKGQFYRILELSIKSSDDVALFKIARGTNTLENMVLYSPSGKARIEATSDRKAVGGLIAYLDVNSGYSTTIENCAVAGYTFYTPRNTEGGLVGYANHDLTIRNCEAVNTFHRRDNDDISTKDNPLGIGGLVGPVGNGHDAFPSLTIENSYAGGEITGNSTVGSVGGLYGGGRAPGSWSISRAYSYMDLSNCWMDTSNLTWTDRETVNTRKEVNTIGHDATGSYLYYYDKSSYLPQYDTTQSNHQWNYQGEGNGQGKATSDLGTISIGEQPAKSYVPGIGGLTDLGSQTGLRAVVIDADGSYVHYGVLPR